MPDYDHEIEKISKEIQMYFFYHPNAADTAEGIAKWWLARQRYEDATSVVIKALEYLVKQGLVVQLLNADKQRIYCKKEGLPCPTGNQGYRGQYFS